MNTHSTSDSGTDAKLPSSGRRGFLGTLGGIAAAAAAVPLLPLNRSQAEPPVAPSETPIQGNAFFD